MMTRGASFGPQAVMKMNLMPPGEGLRHLLAEMGMSFPESEILFTDGQYHPAFYPIDAVQNTPAGPGAPSAMAMRSPAVVEEIGTSEGDVTRSAPTPPSPPPLIDRFTEEISGIRGVAECRLDPLRDPFLAQHRFRDRPLLPFVMGVELMAEAVQCLVGARPVTVVEDIEILNGLRFFDDQPQTARVKVVVEGDAVRAELVCDFRNRSGKLVEADRPYARARVRLDTPLVPLITSGAKEPTHWENIWYPKQREEVLYHGPVFRRLSAIRFDDQGGWAKISAPGLAELAGPRSITGWFHSPATLDACLFACGIYPWFYQDQVIAIPHSLGRLRLGGHPEANESCLLRIDYLGREGSSCKFHFTLYGEDRRVLLRAEEFHASIVPNQSQRSR